MTLSLGRGMVKKSIVKYAIAVYFSITVAVITTIAYAIIFCFDIQFTLRNATPAITGLTWIIAIVCCVVSGFKANIRLGGPFLWWWR